MFSGFVYAGEDEDAAKEEDIEYLEMKPKFTVNLAERRKYLMVKVQLLIEGEKYIEKVRNSDRSYSFISEFKESKQNKK